MSQRGPIEVGLAAAAAAPSLLVATDYDGVLAPFEKDPMAATPLPGTMQDLHALAALPGVHVAVVSGRDLATLRALTGIGPDDAITLIGSHGAESSSAAVRSAMEAAAVTADDELRLDELRRHIGHLVAEHHPEAGIEYKSAAVVVHTRGLEPSVADAAIAAARLAALEHPGVKVLKGKSVLELSVSHADKGSAVTALGRHHDVAARIYFGDDVTDEDAFMRMTRPTDVTVKVGAGSTAAGYRVDDEAAVAAALARLVALATAAHGGPVEYEGQPRA